MVSIYNPLVPTGTVNLDVDYQNLQNNFSQLNTTYGVDHYKYSDQTANNGFHNTVTLPAFQNPSGTVKATPPTTTTNPVLYAFQPLSGDNGTPTSQLGVLQYSRGPSNAVPTPVTMRQSSSTPIILASNGSVTNVFDFTGLTQAYGKAIAVALEPGFSGIIESDIVWNSSTALVKSDVITSATIFQFFISGNILQIKNLRTGLSPALDNVYWTLQFYRTS